MDTSIFGQTDPAQSVSENFDSSVHDAYRVSSELAPGANIHGKYIVNGVLGHGGFAVVYDAEHVGLERAVAIKVLHIGSDTPLALIERFRREARISALVHHPNVLEVYDTGQLADGSPYLVMERVNGENLSTLIRRGPLPIATTVEIGRQLLLGLAAIADAGIVHRDVKPDNVMLHDAGDGTPVVKLVDFGISKHVSIEPHARLTCHGALVGTPQYMSPEQIRGQDVDTRSDLYAAGAVLYEALAGQAPHQSDNFSELVVAVLNNQIRPLRELRANCPVELEGVIFTALSRARAGRYESARHMLEALEEVTCSFDLPRGIDAFRATDPELPLRASAARSSTPGDRKLWGFGLGQLMRPMPLALAALAFGLPKLVSYEHAESPRQQTVRHAPAATLASTTQGLGADALAEVFAGNPVPALTPAAPQASPLLDPQRYDFTPFADVASSDTPSAREAPRVARSTPTATASTINKRKVGLAAPTLGAPKSAASPVVGHTAVQRPVVLTAEQRVSWDKSMQSALAALVRGRLTDAKSSYAQAVRLAPDEAAGFRGLGLVAARLGQNDEARAALRRYLALSPHAGDAQAITARLQALPN